MAFQDKKFRRRNSYRPVCELLESRRVLASLAGSVFVDTDGDYDLDEGEPAIANAVVYLDTNNNGELDHNGYGLEPDDFVAGQVLNYESQSVFTSATASDNKPAFRVIARADVRASTGDLVFGHEDTSWESDRRLRFDLTIPADSVALAVVGNSATAATVRLDAYSTTGTLLQTVTIPRLSNSEIGSLSLERAQQDIKYVVAYVTNPNAAVNFDNFQVEAEGSEPSTRSRFDGFYRFPNLPNGSYFVAQQDVDGYDRTNPDRSYEVSVGPHSVSRILFANRTNVLGGSVFTDVGTLGTFEAGIDVDRPNVAIYLDTDRDGTPNTTDVSVPPSIFVEDQVLDHVAAGLRISTSDADNARVMEYVTATKISDSAKVFAHEGITSWTNDRRMRVDFDTPASAIAIDFIGGNATDSERGILMAYDSNDLVIDTVITDPLALGMGETMSITRNGHNIAYVVAYTLGAESGNGRLDNLRATFVTEPVAFSSDDGEFRFSPLQAGNYRVAKVPIHGETVTLPAQGFYDQPIADTETIDDLRFGVQVTNQAPIARGDSAVAAEDTAVTLHILLNDEDPDGSLNTSSIAITRSPLRGSLQIVGGEVTYTPDEDFAGSDSFVYTVRDDQGQESNTAIVVFTVTPVNDPPTASDDSASVVQGSPTVIGVLSNDLDIDSDIDARSIKITQTPVNGLARVNQLTGTITYTPNAGFTGVDRLEYTVMDVEGAESNAATVEVIVVNAGTVPTARDDSATTPEGTKVEILVTANDVDTDGRVVPESVVVTTLPSQGRVNVNATTGAITYQPSLGFVGTDTFRYQVRDNAGLASNEAEVTVTTTEREFPYQNPINRLDVNGDGQVVPRDALLIIIEINSRRVSKASGAIIANPSPPDTPTSYLDVTGDGFIVAGDVLQIINFLNAQNRALVAVAEPMQANAVAAAFADLDDNEGDTLLFADELR